MDRYNSWLRLDVQKREICFRLKQAFAKLREKFSFLRLEGLTLLVSFLKEVPDTDIPLYQQLQELEEFNILAYILKYILKPTLQPEFSAISSQEKLLALEVFQGACLLHHRSKLYPATSESIVILLDLIDSTSQSSAIQCAALESLLAVLCDAEPNQEIFNNISGCERVVKLLRPSKSYSKETRLKSVEFLTLFCRFTQNDNLKKRLAALLGGDKSLEQLLSPPNADNITEAVLTEHLKFLEKKLPSK